MTTLATPTYWPTRDLPTNGHQPITLPSWVSTGAVEEPADVLPAEAAPVETVAEQPAPVNAKVVKLDAELETAARRASYMRTGFYVVVLTVALAGQVTGAIDALGIPLLAAIPAVAALEVGGIVVMQNADVRRRLGERATGSRILSALIAAWAVAFNWLAHDNHLLGGFFAGMSALGYLVWLMHTENQRRDRLRATGDLPAVTPAYEIFGHWLTHPLITRRARSLAKADAALNLYTSLERAREQVRQTRRTRAIARVMRQEMRASTDTESADIALAVYDLERIAVQLADDADYAGLTRLIAARLEPKRVAGVRTPDARTHPQTQADVRTHAPAELPVHAETHALADAPAASTDGPVEAAVSAPAHAPAPRPKRGQNGRPQPRTSGASVDTDAIKKLHALARANGGSVSVRQAMNALGAGAPVTKRHMRAAGLLPASDTENGATP